MDSIEVLIARLEERDKNHDERYSKIEVQLTKINTSLTKQEGRLSANESSLKSNQKVAWGALLASTGLTAFFNFLKP